MTLKSGLRITQDHWKWCHSKAWLWFMVYDYGYGF